MFSKPDCGWTDIKIGDFIGRGSYLTDIPVDCLNVCIFALSNNSPLSFFIDEEGSEVIVTSYYDCTYIVRKYEGGYQEEKFYSYTLDFRDLVIEILHDIEDYYDDWVQWLPYDKEYGSLNRNEFILSKVSQLKDLLNKF